VPSIAARSRQETVHGHPAHRGAGRRAGREIEHGDVDCRETVPGASIERGPAHRARDRQTGPGHQPVSAAPVTGPATIEHGHQLTAAPVIAWRLPIEASAAPP